MAETSQNTSWVDSFSPEDKQFLTTKGWDKAADANAAFGTVLKSYREAESYLGIPRDEVFRVGKEPTAEQITPILKRLGVPDTADGYKFEGVPDDRAKTLRELAFQHKLTPTQAQGLVAGLTKAEQDAKTAADAAFAVTSQAEDVKLRAAAGGNYDVIVATTDAFFAKHGFTPEQASAFKATAGGRMLAYALASADKEGGMPGLTSPSGGGKLPMTPAQAAEELQKKQADPAWAKKWFAGDAETVKEFQDLTTLMVSRPRAA